MTTYDTLIIGGGMVGATLALALTDRKVALIDAAPLSITDDPRLIALNYSSICLFKNLGIWPALLPHATPIKQLHVSHRGKFGITRIHHQEVDLPALGFLIPAKFINAALDEKLKSMPQIEIIRPAKLKNLTQTDEKVTVIIEKNATEETLHAKNVIGADGTHSTVRELLSIPTEQIDYDQSAIVTITTLQRDHHHIAYERFIETGAIAMLPMSEQRVATIWTDQNKKIAALMQLSDTDFLTKLQTEFGYRLGRLQQIEKRHIFPLHFIKAKESQKQNVILIGNAAHTIHPVAAQGLNLALYEIAELAESMNQTNQLIAPTGNALSLKLSHHLNSLFATDFSILNQARQLGMLGFDMTQKAKQFFLRKTMGQTGRVPLLLQEKDVYETRSHEQ